MKIVLSVLAALLFSNTNASAQNKAKDKMPDKNFYVFLSFGQSNMEGFPGIEEQDKGPVDNRFQVLAAVDFPEPHRQKGQWHTAVPLGATGQRYWPARLPWQNAGGLSSRQHQYRDYQCIGRRVRN